jgi:hypothetical protein
MSIKDVAIIVVAKGIDQYAIDRFKKCVAESKPSIKYDILIGTSSDSVFYKTRILNNLLRTNFDKYNVIIQTDIDLIIPPKLIDITFSKTNKGTHTAYHHFLRYIEPIEINNKTYKEYPFRQWSKLPAKFCSGCWNGMSCDSWKKTRGYNEDINSWGGDDEELFRRSKRLGIQWIKSQELGLVHINHPPRQKNNSKQNMRFAELYSDETDWFSNKKVLKKKK